MKTIQLFAFLLALLFPLLGHAATPMSIQVVGVGSGETLPTAFTKINNNFSSVTNKLYHHDLTNELFAILHGNTFSGTGANLRSNTPIFQSGMNLGNFVTAGLVVGGSAEAIDFTAAEFTGAYFNAGFNNTDLRPPRYFAATFSNVSDTNDLFRGAYDGTTVFRVDYLGNTYLNNSATPAPTEGQIATRLANGSVGWADAPASGVSQSELNASFHASTNYAKAATNAEHAYWESRVSAAENNIAYAVRIDVENPVDHEAWSIADLNQMQHWHIDFGDGYDGDTNPNLISRIGVAETQVNKTFTAPTINGGSIANAAISSSTVSDSTFSGTVNFGGVTVLGGLNDAGFTNTTLAVRDVSDVSKTVWLFEPLGGGSGGSSATLPRVTLPRIDETAALIEDVTWDYGWWDANNLIYRKGTMTYARLIDATNAANTAGAAALVNANANITAATNLMMTFIQNDRDTNATQAATLAALAVPGTGARGTGYFNLSIPQAKLPNTNFAVIAGGWQNWELMYLRTNGSGALYTNSAFWSLPVPPDYVSNTMTIRLLSILNATNGPNSSNSIFRVSTLTLVPGTTTDIHVGAFGPTVSGTNTWTALSTGTNQVQTMTLSLTNCLSKAGDMLLLKVDRDCAADTVNGPVSIVGATLEYLR